jgi:hypothetical protein
MNINKIGKNDPEPYSETRYSFFTKHFNKDSIVGYGDSEWESSDSERDTESEPSLDTESEYSGSGTETDTEEKETLKYKRKTKDKKKIIIGEILQAEYDFLDEKKLFCNTITNNQPCLQ